MAAAGVKTLLERGADPNITDWCGHRPIDTAAIHDHGQVVELLIRARSKYEFKHVLAARLLPRVVELLDRDPELVNRHIDGNPDVDDPIGTPLHIAVGHRGGNLGLSRVDLPAFVGSRSRPHRA